MIKRYTVSGVMTPVEPDEVTTTKWIKEADHIKEVERLKGRWISVTDNLPEERELVLVYCTDSGCVGTAWMVGDEWCISEPQAIGRANLTHWMPLPEPPEDV